MNIQGISIIATYGCNLSCGHCFFGREQSGAYLDPSILGDNLAPLSEEFSWIHFTGGEPLLKPERLYSLLDVVAKQHKGNIGIATNGYWGSTPEKAAQIVGQLVSRGVDGISLSIDQFHQSTIPLETIHHSAMAISDAGISGHCWIVTSLIPEDVPDSERVNAESLEMAGKVSAESGIPIATAEVRPIGRGSSTDAVTGTAQVPDGPCKDLACCLGETGPFDPQMVWIDPFGNVQICYGITIGSLNDTNLIDLLEHYDSSSNPLLKVLAEEGPIGFYRMVADEGGDLGPDPFRDECDLCFRTRRALRSRYPETLSPPNAYPLP